MERVSHRVSAGLGIWVTLGWPRSRRSITQIALDINLSLHHTPLEYRKPLWKRCRCLKAFHGCLVDGLLLLSSFFSLLWIVASARRPTAWILKRRCYPR